MVSLQEGPKGPADASGMEAGNEISPRDEKVLEAIVREGFTVFTFDGLRRLLGMHQETLSRTLDRLESEGLVERVPDGYRITEQTDFSTKGLRLASQTIPLVQTILPPGSDVNMIVSGLKGRWFGNLRWLGYSQTSDGTVLKWITDGDGIQVDAKFTDTVLTIEARVEDSKDPRDAVNASYQLLANISRLHSRSKRPKQSMQGMFRTVAYYPGFEFA